MLKLTCRVTKEDQLEVSDVSDDSPQIAVTVFVGEPALSADYRVILDLEQVTELMNQLKAWTSRRSAPKEVKFSGKI